MPAFDYTIIGQGLAGSTMAWHLRWLGKRVAVIDRDEVSTASRIASGLISPIAGKRNAVSWRFNEFWPVAKKFYERVQSETKTCFFRCHPMLRVMTNEVRLDNPMLKPFLGERSKLNEPLNSNFEAIEFSPAAKLDVSSFLDVTRTTFETEQAHFVADIDPRNDIEFPASDTTYIRQLGIQANTIIFCQGITAKTNPWLKDVQFEPAKGEILTLEIPDLTERRVVHGNVWLAPSGNGRFQVGATYEHDFADNAPTEAGRDEVLRELALFGAKAFEVVDHQAAIRPIIRGRRPIVGQNKIETQICHINGLGSKGALQAPFLAQQLCDFLVHGTNIDEEVRIPRDAGLISSKRFTEIAHEYVSQALSEGDIAIDATAGNGYDTLQLSRLVGENGHVFAIDKQQVAIERTRSRLESANRSNVTLSLGSHDRLNQLIPPANHGRIAAIMLNLGYLPRGDKDVTTMPGPTISAIGQGLRLLKRGGVMTILAYTGHPGAMEETLAVEDFIERLTSNEFETQRPVDSAPGAPRLYVITKQS